MTLKNKMVSAHSKYFGHRPKTQGKKSIIFKIKATFRATLKYDYTRRITAVKKRG